jgi:5-carboxymethyl-2-hydroxymuconate isomerase
MSRAAEDGPDRRVLVLGRRQGLEAALRRRGLPYVLWLDKEPQGTLRGVPFVVAPFPATRKAVEKVCSRLTDAGPFTHCIAPVEASVVAASHARRVLGARKSPHSIALRCHDKLIMKRRLRDAEVPITDFVDLGRQEELARADELGRPLVVKDRKSSGSRGVEVVTDPGVPVDELRARGRMAERYVVGDEMSVESFVHKGRVRWTNTTRYWRPKHVNVVPAGLDAETHEAVLDLNRRALEALAIRWGMTHLELFLSADGPLVGEVALRPPGGYIMRCLELAYGFDPWDATCAVELGDAPQLPRDGGRPTAVVVLHPGQGTVARVRGLDALRAHPAHLDTRLKVGAGSEVAERVGVGEDVGRVVLQADDHAALDAAIRFVEEQLVIELA